AHRDLHSSPPRRFPDLMACHPPAGSVLESIRSPCCSPARNRSATLSFSRCFDRRSDDAHYQELRRITIHEFTSVNRESKIVTPTLELRIVLHRISRARDQR